jgi:F-type H+-transporting ATPase subunit epsilon
MPFSFELVSPERLVFTGDVDAVVVPGMEGEFTVLKDHAPLMSTLKPGIVEIAGGSAGKMRLYVRGGFADVASTGLTILAEYAVPLEDLDAGTIDADIAAATSAASTAVGDETRRAAAERRDQLTELKASLARS